MRDKLRDLICYIDGCTINFPCKYCKKRLEDIIILFKEEMLKIIGEDDPLLWDVKTDKEWCLYRNGLRQQLREEVKKL